MKWYLQVLKKYAVFSGRSRRKEYWMFTLFNIIIPIVILTIIALLLGDLSDLQPQKGEGGSSFYRLFYIIYNLAVFIPGLAVSVRRLHDIGKSGWMILIALIPLIGAIWLLVLMVTDSIPGENKYGPNPKGIAAEEKINRNRIGIIIIISSIVILFTLIIISILNKPSKKELERKIHLRDSLELVRQQNEIGKIKEQVVQVVIEQDKLEENISPENLIYRYGIFAEAAIGKQSFITLENNLIRLVISTKGGRPFTVELKKYKTYDSMPLILFDGDSTIFGFEFFANNRIIFTNNLFFETTVKSNHLIVKESNQTLKLKLNASENSYIEYVYTIKPNSHLIDFNVNFVNMDNIIASNSTYLDLNWQIYAPRQEKNAEKESNYTTIGYKFQDEKVSELWSKGKEKESKEINTKLKWIAFKQQYFSSILITENYFSNSYIEFEKLNNSEKYLKLFKAEIGIPYIPGSVQNIPFQFYFGPNHFNTMKQYKQDYEKLIPLLQRWFFFR